MQQSLISLYVTYIHIYLCRGKAAEYSSLKYYGAVISDKNDSEEKLQTTALVIFIHPKKTFINLVNNASTSFKIKIVLNDTSKESGEKHTSHFP